MPKQAPAPVSQSATNTPNSGRDAKGRWVKGVKQKAGPGRPKAEFSISALLKAEIAKRPEAVMRIIDLCASKDERVALAAILGLVRYLEPKDATALEIHGDGTQVLIVRDAPGLNL